MVEKFRTLSRITDKVYQSNQEIKVIDEILSDIGFYQYADVEWFQRKRSFLVKQNHEIVLFLNNPVLQKPLIDIISVTLNSDPKFVSSIFCLDYGIMEGSSKMTVEDFLNLDRRDVCLAGVKLGNKSCDLIIACIESAGVKIPRSVTF